MSPSTSKRQKTLFCIAQSIKEGKTPESYSKKAAEMAGSMSLQQLKDYCGSKVES